MPEELELNDPRLLAELDLLFAQDSVVDLSNDAQWNCYAKAYAVMWLLRLLGEPADAYDGKLAIIKFDATRKELSVVAPHCWAGSSPRAICDLSIRGVAGCETLSVLGKCVAEDGSWEVFAELDPKKFAAIASGQISTADRRSLIYHPENLGCFRPEAILDPTVVRSPATQRTLSRYPKTVLSKAILHLFLFLSGTRPPLTKRSSDPWGELNAWKIDAMTDLTRLL